MQIVTSTGHSLCGELEYEPLYEGLPLTGGEPVTYAVDVNGDTTDTFVFNSNDYSLTNTTATFGVRVTLASWPTAEPHTSDAEVTYTSPCIGLNTFEAVGQDNLPDDEYSETVYEFSLNRFTIEPSVCTDTVTYECTSVVGPPDGNDNTDYTSALCSNFDGIFDADAPQLSDGKLTV